MEDKKHVCTDSKGWRKNKNVMPIKGSECQRIQNRNISAFDEMIVKNKSLTQVSKP